MSTKIKFKDTEFELVENNLDILETSFPIIMKYMKLEKEYIGDVDKSLIKFYEKRIKELEEAIKQISELEPTAIYEGEQTNEQKIIELTEKLQDVKTAFSEDEECNATRELVNKLESNIMVYIAMDKKVMSKFYKSILKGDTSKIEYKGEDYKLFAAKVLESFFLLLQRNKNELTGLEA